MSAANDPRWAAAVHEAGHAVAAYLFRAQPCHIGHIWIGPADWPTGGVEYDAADVIRRLDTSGRDRDDQVVGALAGPLAEMIATGAVDTYEGFATWFDELEFCGEEWDEMGAPGETGGSDDYEKALRLLARRFAGDFDIMAAGRTHAGRLSQLERQTLRRLREPSAWAAVEAVAKELTAQPGAGPSFVTGAKAQELMDSANGRGTR